LLKTSVCSFVFSLQTTLSVFPLLMESENLTALQEEVHKPHPKFIVTLDNWSRYLLALYFIVLCMDLL